MQDRRNLARIKILLMGERFHPASVAGEICGSGAKWGYTDGSSKLRHAPARLSVDASAAIKWS
jgi:hypothetical protein